MVRMRFPGSSPGRGSKQLVSDVPAVYHTCLSFKLLFDTLIIAHLCFFVNSLNGMELPILPFQVIIYQMSIDRRSIKIRMAK